MVSKGTIAWRWAAVVAKAAMARRWAAVVAKAAMAKRWAAVVAKAAMARRWAAVVTKASTATKVLPTKERRWLWWRPTIRVPAPHLRGALIETATTYWRVIGSIMNSSRLP